MILFLAVSEHAHDFSIFHVRFRFPCPFPLSVSCFSIRLPFLAFILYLCEIMDSLPAEIALNPSISVGLAHYVVYLPDTQCLITPEVSCHCCYLIHHLIVCAHGHYALGLLTFMRCAHGHHALGLLRIYALCTWSSCSWPPHLYALCTWSSCSWPPHIYVLPMRCCCCCCCCYVYISLFCCKSPPFLTFAFLVDDNVGDGESLRT